MTQIQASGDEIIILKQESRWLDESDQRQLLAWFAREKPEMVRNAMGVDTVIATLEETLAHSKKNVYGFTAEEAGWVGGYESGLTMAIALLKGEVGK